MAGAQDEVYEIRFKVIRPVKLFCRTNSSYVVEDYALSEWKIAIERSLPDFAAVEGMVLLGGIQITKSEA